MVEHLVLLFVDQLVRARLSEPVAVELIRVLRRLVVNDVEERLVVGRPRRRRNALGDLRRLARPQVFDVERVLAEAGRVGRVGQKVRVRGHVEDADGHEGVTLRHLVEVEQHLLGRLHRAFAAREDRVLLTLLGARVVHVAGVTVRDVGVGLLDAREHLLVEPLLKRPEVLRHRVRVRVLGVEVGDDLRVLLVAHPEVVVRELCAVNLDGARRLLRDRRRGGRRGGCVVVRLRLCHGQNVGRNKRRQRERRQGEPFHLRVPSSLLYPLKFSGGAFRPSQAADYKEPPGGRQKGSDGRPGGA